ncbi:MAG: hypothetical protein CUN55_08755 [Phototrophicales bacterium]|nr:MAG: hypothetical protein CUN55_08755 [Phototrophicales bacterium]
MSENPYSAQLADMVVSNSSLTDAFTDEEAMPLIHWASQQGERIGQQITTDEEYENVSNVFAKWIRTVLAIISRRGEADAEWISKMIERLNEYASTLHTKTITSQELEILLQNTALDVQQFADLFLPMFEASSSENLIEQAREALGHFSDVLNDSLRDVSTVEPQEQDEQPPMLSDPPDNPLVSYDTPIEDSSSQNQDDESETTF